MVPDTRAVSYLINKMIPSPEKRALWEEVNMCTADRTSMLADFVIDGLHFIFRALNKKEADKEWKKKKGQEEQMDLCFSTTVMGFRSFYKYKSKSLWLPN